MHQFLQHATFGPFGCTAGVCKCCPNAISLCLCLDLLVLQQQRLYQTKTVADEHDKVLIITGSHINFKPPADNFWLYLGSDPLSSAPPLPLINSQRTSYVTLYNSSQPFCTHVWLCNVLLPSYSPHPSAAPIQTWWPRPFTPFPPPLVYVPPLLLPSHPSIFLVLKIPHKLYVVSCMCICECGFLWGGSVQEEGSLSTPE